MENAIELKDIYKDVVRNGNVESLERRRNLHVCSGDCHTEE